MTAQYNEIDPFAAAWLRNLSAAGHVAPGEVDERSIAELQPSDITATQAHFFAGIGVWSYALKLAGWPDDVPVWTGSCPCQPFSAAGKRAGTADARHLWPEWFRLIRECRPPVVLGEQVASAGDWLDLVSSDLEAEGYAFGAAVLGSHSVGAPHIRQRLYFVAYADGERLDGIDPLLLGGRPQQDRAEAAGSGEAGSALAAARSDAAREQPPGLRDAGLLADPLHAGWPERRPSAGDRPTAGSGIAGQLGNPGSAGLQERERNGSVQREALGAHEGQAAERGSNASFWSNAEWIPCRDGKSRPVEPGTFPLAHGAASRVGRLRAYGNALNAQQAATFIRAAMSSIASGR